MYFPCSLLSGGYWRLSSTKMREQNKKTWQTKNSTSNPTEMKLINMMLVKGDLRKKISDREDNPFILEHGRRFFRNSIRKMKY